MSPFKQTAARKAAGTSTTPAPLAAAPAPVAFAVGTEPARATTAPVGATPAAVAAAPVQAAAAANDGAPSPYPDARPGARVFRGRTLEELLPRIRVALGPDAIVLRRREGLQGGTLGFFQSRYVEVEAIAGEPDGPASASGGLDGGVAGGAPGFDAYDDDVAWPEDVADDGVTWLDDAVAPSTAATPVRTPGRGADAYAATAGGPRASSTDTALPAPAAGPPALEPAVAAGLPWTTTPDGIAPIDGAAFLRHLDAAVERRRTESDVDAPVSAAVGGLLGRTDLAADEAPAAAAALEPVAAARPSHDPAATDQHAGGRAVALWSPAQASAPAAASRPPKRWSAATALTAPGIGEPETIAGPASGRLELRDDVDGGPSGSTGVETPAITAPHTDVARTNDAALHTDTVGTTDAGPHTDIAGTTDAAPHTDITGTTDAAPHTDIADTTDAATATIVATHVTTTASASGAGHDRRTPTVFPGADSVRTPARRTVDVDVAEYGLIARGLSPAIARSVVAEAAAHGQPLDPGHRIDRATRAALARRIPRTGPRDDVRTMVVTGGPGAGRTSAVGALAAAHARAGRRVLAVAMGSLDRGAALAAAVVGTDVELLVVGDGATAAAAIRVAAPDVCIVDTPAVNPADRTAAEALATQLRDLGADEVLLAVPGTHATGAVHDVLDGLAPLGANALVLTHRDRAERPGGIVGASIVRGLPIAYVTDGDAIALADPARLARMIQP